MHAQRVERVTNIYIPIMFRQLVQTRVHLERSLESIGLLNIRSMSSLGRLDHDEHGAIGRKKKLRTQVCSWTRTFGTIGWFLWRGHYELTDFWVKKRVSDHIRTFYIYIYIYIYINGIYIPMTTGHILYSHEFMTILF